MLLQKKGKIQFKLFSYLLSNKLEPKAFRSFPEGVEPKISLKIFRDAFPLHTEFYMINQMRNKRFPKGKGKNKEN